jgi:hypothetical protein
MAEGDKGFTREEFKEILKDYVGGVMASLVAEANSQSLSVKFQFDLIKQQLEQIVNTTEETKEDIKEVREQTTKTNGRVNGLEIRESSHITNCPIAPQVRDIKENLIAKQAVNKFLIVTLGVLSTCLGIILGSLAVGTKLHLF